MKWHAQVLHVVRKDFQLVRWMIVTYACLVAAATAIVFGWIPFGAPSVVWVLALIVAGVLVFARLIQADPPARSDAYWAVLPISRSAMFASKVTGGVAFLLVVALAGQYAALRGHGVEASAVPGLLAASALSYGVWLALAGALAALTPDLRTFLLTFLLTVVGWTVGMGILASLTGGFPPEDARGSGHLFIVGMAGGALLLLAHQYRTRDVRQGVRIAALAGGVLLALSASGWGSAPRPDPAPAVLDDLRPAALRIEDVRIVPGGRGGAQFAIRMEGFSRHHLYRLLQPTGRLHLPNGSSVALPIEPSDVPLNETVPDPGPGVRWLGADLPREHGGIYLRVDLTGEHRDLLSRGEARLVVHGDLEVREARTVARLPLEPGASTASNGYRLLHLSSPRAGNVMLRVRVSTVHAERWVGRPFSDAAIRRAGRYALMNPHRGEALSLAEGEASGSDLALVIPGPRGMVRDATLQQSPSDTAVDLTREWIAESHLLLFDWVPVAREPVVFEPGNAPRRERVPTPG